MVLKRMVRTTLAACGLFGGAVNPAVAQAVRPDWERVVEHAPWSARDSCGEVVFKEHLWLLGGWVALEGPGPRDVWKSPDGKNWTRVVEQAPWTHADLSTMLVFKDRMWLMAGWYGGRSKDASSTNEVWSSADGAGWDRVTPAAQWGARLGAAGVVFKDKMWILGGAARYFDGSKYLLNDVWTSADGKDWTRVTEHAPWSPRAYHAALAFNDRIWVFGGGNYRPDHLAFNDVWSSADGLNWTRPFTQPIISSSERQPSAENRYGVGYVSAMRVGPYFYLFFVDTLGADSNAGNGAGIYVRRSTDPLFQSSVEELVADNPDLNSSTYPPPGQVRWAVPTPANRTTYALFQAFQVDWTFSPATIEFVAAHPVGGGCFTRQPSTVPGCEIRFKFFPLALDNPPVSGYGWWDMQPNAEFGQPMNWNGRPTVVGTTERHVRTSPDGRYLKLDTIRGVGDACVPGGPNYPTCFGAWDLAGASLEMDTGLTGSCAVDLDSDGMPNLQELENLRNPSGGAVNYLAEGSTGGSLSMATTIGLSNPSTTPATGSPTAEATTTSPGRRPMATT